MKTGKYHSKRKENKENHPYFGEKIEKQAPEN